MNIWVYSDESGVFDKVHNLYYVYGGLIILGDEAKDNFLRKYLSVERTIRKNRGYSRDYEIKATSISNKDKSGLFRSLNNCYKFGVIIEQSRVLDNIFNSKKDKQRYLDYVYKIGVKNAFQKLIKEKIIIPSDVETIYFHTDEHNTATNGKYELQQGLEQEFKHGTYNYNYSVYFPPIFPDVKGVQVLFCNSSKNVLVRAADIVANRIYYLAVNNMVDELKNIKNLYYITQP